MVPLLWLLLIVAAAHGYGHIIGWALKLRLPTRLEQATIAIGLGTGFLMVATFVLGLVHLMGRRSSVVMIVPAAAFGIWKVVASLRGTTPTPVTSRGLRLAVSSALAICVIANLVGTLAPPSFIDALVYHLFIAKTYVQSGGIVELPSIWQSYQPLGVEMLFMLGLSLHSAVLAALTHTGLGLLAASATCLLGRRIAGPLGGALAAAIFYCTAMVTWESTSCFVELGITAFSTLGFYALVRWSDDEDPRWLIAAALFMGVAGTCKLTAIQFSVVAAGLMGWISLRRGRGLGVISARVAAFVGISVGLGLPWYAHSYLWTGNPVYPFATEIFGDNAEYANVWSILSHYGPGHGVRDLLLAPWRLFSNGAIFECAQYLSPLPFILGPLILWRLNRPAGPALSPLPSVSGASGNPPGVLSLKGARDRQVLAAAAGMAFVLWLASAHVARYLIPLQPLLAVLAADAVCWAAGSGSRYYRRLVLLTGALIVGFGTASAVLAVRPLAPVVFHRESSDSYLARTALFYTLYRSVMAEVPENGLILTNQGPTLYLDRPHVRVHNAEFLAGPDRLSRVVAGANYTHILVHGYDAMEASVLALGPRVKLLWHRQVDVPLSRTFGGTKQFPAALFEIVR